MKKTILALTIAAFTLAGCSSTGDAPVTENTRSETEDAQIKEEAFVEEPEISESDKEDQYIKNKKDKTVKAETENEGNVSVSADALEEEDPDVQESDTVQDLLDRYMNDPEKKDFEYIMFDVNADGIEEIIFTDNGKIAEIYGMRNSKPNFTVVCPESLDMTLYPKGMLRAQSNEKSEYDTKDMWMQYFPEWGDFLSVFEELDKEYYTFCAYNLSDEEIREINGSVADINDFPVWLYEWSDMISKKDFERLVPKDSPVKLPEADSLSNREALEVIPEYLRFVNASDGYANLRTGPGTEYDVICRVPNGHDLEVYRKKGTSKSGKSWLKVTYFTEADNEDGYMWLDGWIAESQLD